MCFSVYFDCILNEKKMLGHATLRENLKKMCTLMRLGEYFDQILY